MNLLDDPTPAGFARHALSWYPQPPVFEPLSEGGIRVFAPAQADYFRDPAGAVVKDDAPFLSHETSGNFVARAHVRPTFSSTYDSAVLMVRADERTWAKLCFEKTDFGATAAVSVVTRELSDDANGVDLHAADLWLQIARQGDVFALHYSLNGNEFRMVRLFHLPVPQAIRVGIAAQSPVGPGTAVDFLHFSIEIRELQNLRAGL